MSLRAYTRAHSGVTVIELEGAVTLGDGSAVLRDVIVKAVEDGHKAILVDLEAVDYIDSAGLGQLVGCNASARARGAELKLVHLQKKIHGLLQLTKLITIFETFEDEEEAVRSFQRSATAEA
jgi:anti-sigma B factor antagonist